MGQPTPRQCANLLSNSGTSWNFARRVTSKGLAERLVLLVWLGERLAGRLVVCHMSAVTANLIGENPPPGGVYFAFQLRPCAFRRVLKALSLM